MDKNEDFNSIIRLLSFMKKDRYVFIILSLGSALVFTANKILMGLASKNLINSVEIKSYSLFYTAACFSITAFVLLVIIDPVIRFKKDIVAMKAMRNFKLNLFSHLEKLPMNYFNDKSNGDLISTLNNDIGKVNQMWYSQLRSLLVSFFHGAGASITILILDWRLFLIVIVMGILSTKANTAFAKSIRKTSENIQANMGLSTQIVLDIITGTRVVKIFNIGESIFRKYKRLNDDSVETTVLRNSKSAGMDSVNFFLAIFNLLGILVIGLYMVSLKLIDIGSVMAVVTLQSGITSMFSGLGNWISRMQVSLASGRRIFEILDCEEEKDINTSEDSFNADVKAAQATIEFKDVCFSYKEKPVLKNLNLSIKSNGTTALVGGSGGGKSSIAKLLLRYYDPQKGTITINGTEISKFSLKQLRSLIAYVPQNSYIFNGTIKENIQFGNLEASDGEIERAAKYANAHEFITSMDKGYNTEIGEGGSKLSGGQKQRIALARAILKAAPILILDEATSALDSENEALVQKYQRELAKDRTSVVIAHRLTTIEDVDKICVVGDGNVIEEGTHNNLIAMKGRYFSLYNS